MKSTLAQAQCCRVAVAWAVLAAFVALAALAALVAWAALAAWAAFAALVVQEGRCCRWGARVLSDFFLEKNEAKKKRGKENSSREVDDNLWKWGKKNKQTEKKNKFTFRVAPAQEDANGNAAGGKETPDHSTSDFAF